MTDLISGANAPISNLQIEIAMAWPFASGSLDASAFLVTENGKVRSDADFVFYNQPIAEGSCVRLLEGQQPGLTRFAVALAAVPEDISRIVFCLTVDTDGKCMSAFDGMALTVTDNGAIVHRFAPMLVGAEEVSMMVAELYKRQGYWKIRAVGQGFRNGLAALATSLGVDIEDEASGAPSSDTVPAASRTSTSPLSPPVPAPLPVPAAPPPPPLPPSAIRQRNRTQGSETFSKGDSLAIAGTGGRLSVTLDWQWTIGGDDGRIRPLTLALGAVCIAPDGSRLAVQQPDGRGQLQAHPWLAITTGHPVSSNSGQERLTLDLDRIADHAQVDVYAFIAAGTASWAGVDAWVHIAGPWASPVEFRIEAPADGMTAITLLRITNWNGECAISRLDGAATNQAGLDERLGWQLAWKTAF